MALSRHLLEMPRNSRYPVILCVLVLIIFGAIELKHPYYFLQDDNRTFFLPYFVHQFNSVSHGEIPLFNFHQYLGTPISILAATFYPLNYVALFVSKVVLGHFYGVMEVVALIHLLIAVVGFYYFTRSLGLAELSCCFGALTWAFCGYVITVGNSWIWVLGYAAYLPWIFLRSLQQIVQPNYRNFILLVVLRVIVFLLGYPQFFAYMFLFESATVMLLYFGNNHKSCSDIGCDSFARHRPNMINIFITYLVGYLATLILVMPLVLPTLYQMSISSQRHQVISWEMYSAFAYKLSYWFNGLFSPFVDNSIKLFGELQYISHIGYLTLACIVIALLSIKNSQSGRYILVFCVLAVVSLMWASDTFITRIFYHIPIYNRFRYPFKVAFFTSFYLIIISTYGFDIVYSRFTYCNRFKRKSLLTVITVVFLFHIGNFIVLYAVLPQHAFAFHTDAIPFTEPMQSAMERGRIVSAGPDVIWDGEVALTETTVPLLGYNYATLWGLYHFGGYEDLVSEQNMKSALGVKNSSVFNVAPGMALNFPTEVPLEHFRLWGVKWYIIDAKVPLGDLERLVLYQKDAFRNILFDPVALPFAYWFDTKSDRGLNLMFKTNSIDIRSDNETENRLVVNVHYNPFFVATIDGMPYTIRETENQQMELNIPKGRHSILITYVDTYFYYGCLISLVFTILIVVAGGRIYFRNRNQMLPTM